MKRYGNLFQKIIEPSNILLAHQNARKGKSHYSEVKRVEQNLEFYLNQTHELLKNKTFRTATYKERYIDDMGKMRKVYVLPYFPDRIIHHAVMNVLQSIWDKTFIFDTYSSVPGRGLHPCLNRLRKFLRDERNTQYCLKFDIKKFYPSVNHDILIGFLHRKIKCKDTLWLLENVVRSASGSTNIPIGNYLSQYFANIYLSGFDHWLKEKMEVKYYVRYCDDGVILHSSKAFLSNLLNEIRDYFGTLELELNSKTQIFPVDKRGIDFLGYRCFRTYTLLRKSSAKRFKKKVRFIERYPHRLTSEAIVSSIMSYYGWLKHCDSYHFLSKFILWNPAIYRIVWFACRSLEIENPLRRLRWSAVLLSPTRSL
jgi:retron-type reverse transcriptase